MFDTPLYFYRFIFMAELFVAEAFFTHKLKKRSRFPLRVILSIIVCYGITAVFPIITFDALYVSAMFVMLFALTIVALFFCYDMRLLDIVFCAVAAYAVQHIAYELYTFMNVALGLDVGSLAYGEEITADYSIWMFATYVESYAAVYALMYVFFGRRIESKEDLRIGNVSLLVISGVIVLVAILFNAILTYRVTEETDSVLVLMAHVYNMICCVLAVAIQFSIFGKKKVQTELDTLQRLHKQEQQHYMLFKENIDYINVKCHDLKHQIRRIASKGAVGDSVIDEIENAVSIYDSDVKSGNEILDIVLTEKRLTCVNNNIAFSCITDGKQINFMSDADICALFGNALDNAIEAVCRIPEAEKRSIGLVIKNVKGFVSVNIRNNCIEIPKFVGDLPKSTKGDEVYHGYGMKSIKAVTERYGGEMSVEVSDGVFSLNLLFPD